MPMMQSWVFGAIALLAILGSAKAQDSLFAFHMGLIAVICLGAMAWSLKTMDVTAKAIPFRKQADGYQDDVVRAGVIATIFWGIAGFLVGLYIALELAYPLLNLDLPWSGAARFTRRP
jgi:cytochrome c oxidase cbb3-type subunit I